MSRDGFTTLLRFPVKMMPHSTVMTPPPSSTLPWTACPSRRCRRLRWCWGLRWRLRRCRLRLPTTLPTNDDAANGNAGRFYDAADFNAAFNNDAFYNAAADYDDAGDYDDAAWCRPRLIDNKPLFVREFLLCLPVFSTWSETDFRTDGKPWWI